MKADRYRFIGWTWIGWSVLDAIVGIWWTRMFYVSFVMMFGALFWDALADKAEHETELPRAEVRR